MTNLKFFPHDYFYRDKEYPLSPSLIIALKKVCIKQKRRIPFGPADVKRSLYPLIERDLIHLTYYNVGGIKKSTWCVTKKGVHTLKSLGKKNHGLQS